METKTHASGKSLSAPAWSSFGIAVIMSLCLTCLRRIPITTFKIFPDSTAGLVCHRSIVLYNLHADWETATTAEIGHRVQVSIVCGVGVCTTARLACTKEVSRTKPNNKLAMPQEKA